MEDFYVKHASLESNVESRNIVENKVIDIVSKVVEEITTEAMKIVEDYRDLMKEILRSNIEEEEESGVLPSTMFNFNEVIEDSMDEGEETMKNLSTMSNVMKNKLTISMDQRKKDFKEKKTWTRLGSNNVRGFKSKMPAISKIFNNMRYSFLAITETHTTAKEKPPERGGMRHFHRGRISDNTRVKGGVSLAVEDELADKCVIVEESEGEKEFIGVQCNAFKPPLVIFTYYGQQEGRTSKNEIVYCLSDLFQRANKYSMRGCTVLITGDFNNACGNNMGMSTNHPSVSRGGAHLIEISEEYNFECLNGMWRGDQTTHWDRSGTVKRALDYFFISVKDKNKVIDLVMDDWNSPEFTPYSILRGKDGCIENRFTDHKMMYVDLDLKEDKNVFQPEGITRWKITPTGLEEYYQLSEVLAESLFLDLEDEKISTESLVNRIGHIINTCKEEAFTKVTRRRRKWEELDEEKEVSEYVNMIMNEAKKDEISKSKPRDRIWKVRKRIQMASRNRTMAAMKKDDGSLATTYEEIGELLTDYNRKLLARREHEGKFKEVFDLKKKMVEDHMKKSKDEPRLTICLEEYEWAIEKIMEKGKNMYKDFIRTGPKFKAAIFLFLKKVFDSEEIPESFWKTSLVSLHKKGPKDLASNYRFLHLRSYLSRLFELLVFKKMQKTFEDQCPDHQIGGQPRCQALEHLTMAFENLREAQSNKGGVIWTMVDVVKMFDNVHLSDVEIELLKGGIEPKILRLHHEICDTNLLSVEGFKYLEFLIKGGLGQGSVLAAADSSLMIALRVEEFINKKKDEEREKEMDKELDEEFDNEIPKLKGVEVNHQEFVDDVLSQNDTVRGCQRSADITSGTLDSLALQSHPQKSVVIVAGTDKFRKDTLEEIEKNPIKLQGNELPISKGDLYLGTKFIEGTLSQIINANIDLKRQKVNFRLIELRRMLRNKRIQQCGWLEAVTTFLKMIIQPIMSWSMAAWPALKKYQEEAIESLYKHAACSLLGINSQLINKAALYLELDTIPFMAIVAYFKITYATFLLHEKKKGRAFKVLVNQKLDGDSDCFAKDVENLCEKYDLESVFTANFSKEFIRDRIWRIEKMKLIQAVNSALYIPMITHLAKHRNDHLRYSKQIGMALLMFNVGRLNFLKCRKGESLKKFGTIMCLARHPSCIDEEDSPEHIFGLNGKLKCQGMRAQWNEHEEEAEVGLNFGRYLLKLHVERSTRWPFLPPLIAGLS